MRLPDFDCVVSVMRLPDYVVSIIENSPGMSVCVCVSYLMKGRAKVRMLFTKNVGWTMYKCISCLRNLWRARQDKH